MRNAALAFVRSGTTASASARVERRTNERLEAVTPLGARDAPCRLPARTVQASRLTSPAASGDGQPADGQATDRREADRREAFSPRATRHAQCTMPLASENRPDKSASARASRLRQGGDHASRIAATGGARTDHRLRSRCASGVGQPAIDQRPNGDRPGGGRAGYASRQLAALDPASILSVVERRTSGDRPGGGRARGGRDTQLAAIGSGTTGSASASIRVTRNADVLLVMCYGRTNFDLRLISAPPP